MFLSFSEERVTIKFEIEYREGKCAGKEQNKQELDRDGKRYCVCGVCLHHMRVYVPEFVRQKHANMKMCVCVRAERERGRRRSDLPA